MNWLKALLAKRLKDLAIVATILLNGLLLGIVVLVFGRILTSISDWLFTGGTWASRAITAVSDLFAVVLFILFSVRDLVRYYRRGQ
jgi:hypothetical protein